MTPVKDKEYRYLGQPVKITYINPYPSTDEHGTVTTKYEVTVETRFGDTATVNFADLDEWNPKK